MFCNINKDNSINSNIKMTMQNPKSEFKKEQFKEEFKKRIKQFI